MCLDNERIPTEGEQKTITEGWKVFRKHGLGGLSALVYRDYNYRWLKRKLGRWFTAKNLKTSLSFDAGFYVFMNRGDAQKFIVISSLCDSDDVTMKVMVKGILAIGKFDNLPAFRCQQIKFSP